MLNCFKIMNSTCWRKLKVCKQRLQIFVITWIIHHYIRILYFLNHKQKNKPNYWCRWVLKWFLFWTLTVESSKRLSLNQATQRWCKYLEKFPHFLNRQRSRHTFCYYIVFRSELYFMFSKQRSKTFSIQSSITNFHLPFFLNSLHMCIYDSLVKKS